MDRYQIIAYHAILEIIYLKTIAKNVIRNVHFAMGKNKIIVFSV